MISKISEGVGVLSVNDWFKDSYKLEWELENHVGKRRIEVMRNVSLSDYEVIYGNNTDHILWVKLELEPHIKKEEGNG